MWVLEFWSFGVLEFLAWEVGPERSRGRSGREKVGRWGVFRDRTDRPGPVGGRLGSTCRVAQVDTPSSVECSTGRISHDPQLELWTGYVNTNLGTASALAGTPLREEDAGFHGARPERLLLGLALECRQLVRRAERDRSRYCTSVTSNTCTILSATATACVEPSLTQKACSAA